MDKEVRDVFCDIRKAFDRVWHAGLIHKLKAASVKEEVLRWFTNYLSEKKTTCYTSWCRIRLNIHSCWSIARPHFWAYTFLNLYMYDIVAEISSNIHLFADDTSLYVIVENPAMSAACLN